MIESAPVPKRETLPTTIEKLLASRTYAVEPLKEGGWLVTYTGEALPEENLKHALPAEQYSYTVEWDAGEENLAGYWELQIIPLA